MALRFSLVGFFLFAGFCKPKAEFSAENNGTVTVYWQNLAVGTLTFARDYETKEVNFVPPENAPGELKLVRESKGAAHIDWLTVNGRHAVPQGAPTNWVKKTNTADSDVLDFPSELVFKLAAADRIHLILRARIEPAVISKIPFRYPLVNQPREFSADSQFLAYAWENRGSCKYPEKAFFSQWALSGSGHVDAYTTFWVSNDRDHLCVRADFSSDNTRDGDKDYAEVVTKAGKKIRHFRISEEHERWGKVHFTYNNMAVHEHKVYEFRIPKSELAGSLKIPLAFALYGTSTPSDMSVAISPFGTVLKGSTTTQTVTVQSIAAASSNLTNLEVLDVAPPISIQNDNCASANLAFNQTCTFDVVFSPTATGIIETPFRIRMQGVDAASQAKYVVKNVIVKATVIAPPQNLKAPSLVSPASGSTNVKSSSLLIWKNGSDGDGSVVTHEILVCADVNFTNCNPISVASLPPASRDTLWGLIPLFLIIGRRRLRHLSIGLALALLLLSCSTDRINMAEESVYSTKEYGRYQLSNVAANTIYYWKVNAKNTTSGELASTVSSFTTGAE